MIVEFIGTPGSGKSTMLPVVQEFLHHRGFRAYSVLEAARPFSQKTGAGKLAAKLFPGKLRSLALWQIFYLNSYIHRGRFSRQNALLVETVLGSQSARPLTKADRRHVLRWFIHLTGYYQFFSQLLEKDEALIYDEGFVHRVVQLFASEVEAPDLDRVAEYLEMIPKPDLVVFTDTPVEICIERVFSRGVWERFRKKDQEDTRRFIRHAAEVVSYAVEKMRQLGWNLVEVQNGTDAIPAARSKLMQALIVSVH